MLYGSDNMVKYYSTRIKRNCEYKGISKKWRSIIEVECTIPIVSRLQSIKVNFRMLLICRKTGPVAQFFLQTMYWCSHAWRLTNTRPNEIRKSTEISLIMCAMMLKGRGHCSHWLVTPSHPWQQTNIDKAIFPVHEAFCEMRSQHLIKYICLTWQHKASP